MISFLIPTYNYDCSSLVFAISKQASDLKGRLGAAFDYEIIVAEDGSNDERSMAANQQVVQCTNCRYLRYTENRRQAKMRNFLISQAQFEYVVLIDSDALVCTDDFVQRYWEARDMADVVCGSLQNLDTCPKGGELRYRYEKAADSSRTMEFRRAHPYAYFTAFNALFHKSVFDGLCFDERCTEYGYEDALMGIMLEKKGYSIAHIDNPLVHNGIDPSAVYLSKVETGLCTLYRLGEPMHSASAMVRMLRRLETLHLLPLVRLVYHIFRRPLRWQLVSRYPSIVLLNFYKLGYFSDLQHQHR